MVECCIVLFYEGCWGVCVVSRIKSGKVSQADTLICLL